MNREHIHFVTGRLAEHALRSILAPLADAVGFDYSVAVMPISVAALMTPAWIARHLQPPPETTRILLPGYCAGDTGPIGQRVPTPVEFGPRDLRQLPEFFGRSRGPAQAYGDFDIEILAEITHAPRLGLDQIRAAARQAKSKEPGSPAPPVRLQSMRSRWRRPSRDSRSGKSSSCRLKWPGSWESIRSAPPCTAVDRQDKPARFAMQLPGPWSQ